MVGQCVDQVLVSSLVVVDLACQVVVDHALESLALWGLAQVRVQAHEILEEVLC